MPGHLLVSPCVPCIIFHFFSSGTFPSSRWRPQACRNEIIFAGCAAWKDPDCLNSAPTPRSRRQSNASQRKLMFCRPGCQFWLALTRCFRHPQPPSRRYPELGPPSTCQRSLQQLQELQSVIPIHGAPMLEPRIPEHGAPTDLNLRCCPIALRFRKSQEEKNSFVTISQVTKENVFTLQHHLIFFLFY